MRLRPDSIRTGGNEQQQQLRPDDVAARTRDWLDQSLQQTRPAGVASLNVGYAPEIRHPPETLRQQTAPHPPRITLEKFGGSALEWPRWVALFKALVHNFTTAPTSRTLNDSRTCRLT